MDEELRRQVEKYERLMDEYEGKIKHIKNALDLRLKFYRDRLTLLKQRARIAEKRP